MKKLGILAVLLLAGIGYMIFKPGPSDAELIKAALKDSIEAGKEGRPGSVLDLLSRNFTVNEEFAGGRANIAKFIRESKPNLTIENPEPNVSGVSATIDSPARIELRFPAVGFNVREVNLKFRKESGTSFLIFPTKVWKLESATVPPEVVTELASQVQM
ncbi:MAG TPA: hypothetical protein PKA27_05305 [Fimbriimonadaceae bacterium]|nr:hypothetical protein [Fimbriimonadaceae bacterium]